MASGKPSGERYTILDASYLTERGTLIEKFEVKDNWRDEVVAKFKGRIAAKRCAAGNNELYGSDRDWEVFSGGPAGA